MLPNLFIVGAPKCGTTAWAAYLETHPDIFVATKERHYYCFDFPGFRLFSDAKSYMAEYEEAGDAPIRTDASVMYLYSEVAAEEIARAHPDARIIVFVRDQMDYLPSLHNQLLYNGIECLADFEEAWRLSGKRNETNIRRWCREPKFLDYLSAGRFHEQVERYFARFPADHIRVFHFNDWVNDPRPVYVEIMDLLGLEDDGRTEFPLVNAAAHHRSQRLGSFTQQPPPWALKVSAIIKKISGQHRLPFVDRIRALNRKEGYGISKPSLRLREEIRSYYAEDNALLEPRIWRPR